MPSAKALTGVNAVLAQFGITPRRIQMVTDNPKKPVWRVVAADGSECYLKRMHVREGRLRFIIAAMQHLNRQGIATPPLRPASSGEDYVNHEGQLFLLSQGVRGQELDQMVHLELITKSMARFHRASRGFQPPPDTEEHTHLGRWPDHFRSKIAELRGFQDLARAEPDHPFHRLFLSEADYFAGQIEQALDLLQPGYDKWVAKVAREGCLCHQDYAASNLRLVGRDVMVFDLDSVTMDLPARDIRKLLNKVMKKGGWELARTQRILEWYTRVYPLNPEERRVLVADLMFPHLFCGAANKHFTNRAEDWTTDKLLARLYQAVRADRQKAAVLQQLLATDRRRG